MISWKKFLIILLNFLFVIVSVLARLSNIGNSSITGINIGSQNLENSVITPNSPDNYLV